MALDAFRHDPGLPPLHPDRDEKLRVFRRLNDPAGNLYWVAHARRLHPDRLACGGAIDVQTRRRSNRPERVMRRVHIAFWFAFWLFLGFAITATIWVQW